MDIRATIVNGVLVDDGQGGLAGSASVAWWTSIIGGTSTKVHSVTARNGAIGVKGCARNIPAAFDRVGLFLLVGDRLSLNRDVSAKDALIVSSASETGEPASSRTTPCTTADVVHTSQPSGSVRMHAVHAMNSSDAVET